MDKFIKNQPNPELLGKILQKINRERESQIWRQGFFFGFGSLFSFGLSSGLFFNFLNEAKTSGFFVFISLLTSDFGFAFSNFEQFIFAILESLPSGLAAFSLLSLAAFIFSFRGLVKSIRSGRFGFFQKFKAIHK